VPVTVFVPETTSAKMRARIGLEGATVRVVGRVWDEAHAVAEAWVAAEGGRTRLVHPFDDPAIWRGHATLIAELADQGPRPDRVVVGVGGGGLLCGVLEGMASVGWSDVEVVAVETEGAASYAAALAAGRPVRLAAIRSVAGSLGALSVCAASVAWAARHPVRSVVVSDAEAVEATVRFADAVRVLVEPACGAALAATLNDPARPADTVVVVCGGAVVDLSLLAGWREALG